MRREFKILNDKGRNLDILAKFESLGNQEPYFSITSQGGSNHEEMAASAPAEVADAVAALIAVHTCNGEGIPMHAVANAAYHLGNGDSDGARRSLGHCATQDDVVRLARKRAELDVLNSAGMRTGMEDALKLAAKRVETAETDIAQAKRDGRTFIPMDKLHVALLSFSQVSKGGDPLPTHIRPDRDTLQAGKKLVDGRVHESATLISAKGLSSQDMLAIKGRVDRLNLAAAVDDLLEAGGLRARWMAAADRAREALSGPDYMIGDRPDPTVDPTTFDGFAAVNGLSLEILSSRGIENGRKECECRLVHAGTGETHDFPYSGPRVPSMADVLETFQTDCRSVMSVTDVDDFLQELGFTGDLKSVRAGEKAFEGCKAEGRALVAMLGEDGMARFMSSVGDDPCDMSDGLPANAFSEAPSPGMR